MPASIDPQGGLLIDLAVETIESFGKLSLRVVGSSMLPAVRPGDVLSVRRGAVHDAAIGDIVLFSRDRRLFAHRVVAIGSQLVTQGDSLPVADAPVSPSEFLGVVERIDRAGRSLAPPRSRTRVARVAGSMFRRSTFAARMFCRLDALRSGSSA